VDQNGLFCRLSLADSPSKCATTRLLDDPSCSELCQLVQGERCVKDCLKPSKLEATLRSSLRMDVQ